MSVVTDFDGGAIVVARGLNHPIEPSLVTAECTISLLECIKLMMSTSLDQSLLDNIIGNLKKSNWLKTTNGYKFPEESILFDTAWDNILYETDAPIIDQRFYEVDVNFYKMS